MRLSATLICGLIFVSTARAIEMPKSLVPPPTPIPERGPAICLRCHGTGKLTKEKSGIKWEGSAMKSFQVTCLTCSGTGRLVRAYTPAERLEKQEQLLAKTANEQLSHGNLPIGAAYLPAAELEALSPEDHAAIARKHPLICEKCFGLGYACCKKCDGTGKKDMEKERRKLEREAEREKRKNKGRVTHSATKQHHPHADADVFAAAQSGISLSCETCFGKGHTPCTKCDGTGLEDICKKCSGSGINRKPARKNKPETVELCRSCKGNGRR